MWPVDAQKPSYFSSPLSTDVPSTVAKYSEVRRLQDDSSTWVANDRLCKYTQFPPVALQLLLYHEFRRFPDCANEDSMDLMFISDRIPTPQLNFLILSRS